MTDEMIAALPQFATSYLFTPREKIALKFAETLAANHLAFDDQLMNELKQHYSEREIMALGWRIGIFIGYGRLVYATGLESVGQMCPIEFRPRKDA